MTIRFLTLAQQELDDAVAWYERQMDGLGQEFLDEFRALRRTLQFPLSSLEIETGIRRCLIARFHYGLDLWDRRSDDCRHRGRAFTPPPALLD